MIKSGVSLSLVIFCSLNAYAESEQETDKESQEEASSEQLETIYITGGKEAIQSLPGSAHLLDSEDLEQFDYTDVNQVIGKVPGVYVRQEDGYGLRPNIGIRGVSPNRSQKITLMEDGILIAPATYSSPAAYYFPNVSRMQALEVFKGPVSIKYGPYTVGGALNLVTKPVSDVLQGEFDISYGSDGFQKYRGLYSDSPSENFGYLVEGFHYSSDGFKELDNGGDTGFERNDLNVKLRFNNDLNAAVPQQLEIKLGYADETSNETYLGLTDDDFARNPDRRYLASQLDKFDSTHWQVHFIHSAELSTQWSLNTKAYYNEFERSWNKFDGLGLNVNPASGDKPGDGFTDVLSILRSPSSFQAQLAVLRGESNSNSNIPESIVNVTDFSRDYGSYGAETSAVYSTNWGEWDHLLTLGLRYHHDYVRRNHDIGGFLMQDGRLVNDGVDYGKKDLNEASTDAIAFYVHDEINYEAWTFETGIRVETIEGEFENKKEGEQGKSSRSDTAVIPGLGALYRYNDDLSLLFGVYKGFLPNGPGADSNVDPEESINIEYGLRYSQDELYAEAIGFFSDYSNLTARCGNRDPSCPAGTEFNAEDVEIYGAELLARYTYDVDSYRIPVTFSYTYTQSEFQNSFDSSFSEWGNVQAGDELPYLPEHIARFEVGVEAQNWDVLLAAKYTGEMREEAGQGSINNTLHTNSLMSYDIATNYYINPSWSVQFKVDNVTDEREVVSRRPFGARPNAPRTVIGTLKYRY